jgi:hypothetical protein
VGKVWRILIDWSIELFELSHNVSSAL